MLPEPWLTDNQDPLPGSGWALDVACGRGRHALWLAAQGLVTVALDRGPDAVRFIGDEALAPGGVLVYETFTTAQAARGRPTNPAFLLDSGELATLVAPLEILRAREGDFGDRWVSSVIARSSG